MKEITVKLYEFTELSEEVRNEIAERKAFDIMCNVMNSFGEEYRESLKAFEEATGFKARNWSVDYGSHYFSVKTPLDYILGNSYNPIYADEVKGELLFRWCRDFIASNRKGKYFGKLVPHAKDADHLAGLEHVQRHSKVLAEPIEGGWCPWTGCITDCPLVEPIVEFYRNYHRGKYSDDYSLEDLMEDCFGKFFQEWEDDYNSWGNNENGIVEEEIAIKSEGDLFFEDGTKFEGVLPEELAA